MGEGSDDGLGIGSDGVVEGIVVGPGLGSYCSSCRAGVFLFARNGFGLL